MPIKATRALLDAALSGELAGVEFRTDPVFGLAVPVRFPSGGRSVEPAPDVVGPDGVRREGSRARRHVPQELRALRRRLAERRRGRAATCFLTGLHIAGL